MLILSRRTGETIKIGDEIEVTVLGVKGNQVRIGVAAPKDVSVHRQETYERIKEDALAQIVSPASAGLLFDGRKLSKIENFQFELERLILSKRKISNIKIYFFTLENGHIVSHSLEVIKKMKLDKKINYSGHPNISYNKCYKDKEIKYFEVNK